MTMKESVRVLMTCVGGQLSPWLLQALKRSERLRISAVGTDGRADALGRGYADSFHQVPFGDDPSYIDRMLELCVRERIDVLFPTSDEEALALAVHQQRFAAEKVKVSCPPAEMAGLMRNKADMYDHLADKGLALPAYRRVRSAAELRQVAAEFGYPGRDFVVKPTVGRGGRGVWVISARVPTMAERNKGLAIDALDLETYLGSAQDDRIDELLAMPMLAGDMFDVDVLADAQGSPSYLVPRHRYHVRTTPFRGCWIDRNPEVLELAAQVQGMLRLPNLFDYDIIQDANGRPWLLEVNPRMSASVAVSVLHGVNLLEFAVLMLLGEKVPEVAIPWGKGGKPVFDLVPVIESSGA